MESIEEAENETLINGIYGLDNLGNTCYLNSIIQTFANIELFKKFLLNNKYIDFFMHKMDEIQTCDFKIKLHKLYDSPIYQFYRLITSLSRITGIA